jgi:hypothetical protein
LSHYVKYISHSGHGDSNKIYNSVRVTHRKPTQRYSRPKSNSFLNQWGSNNLKIKIIISLCEKTPNFTIINTYTRRPAEYVAVRTPMNLISPPTDKIKR